MVTEGRDLLAWWLTTGREKLRKRLVPAKTTSNQHQPPSGDVISRSEFSRLAGVARHTVNDCIRDFEPTIPQKTTLEICYRLLEEVTDVY